VSHPRYAICPTGFCFVHCTAQARECHWNTSHFCIPYVTITVSNFFEIHWQVLQMRQAKDNLTSWQENARNIHVDTHCFNQQFISMFLKWVLFLPRSQRGHLIQYPFYDKINWHEWPFCVKGKEIRYSCRHKKSVRGYFIRERGPEYSGAYTLVFVD
jgi:hypothetical protein